MQEDVVDKSAILSNADEACDVVPAFYTWYLKVTNLYEIDGFFYT